MMSHTGLMPYTRLVPHARLHILARIPVVIPAQAGIHPSLAGER